MVKQLTNKLNKGLKMKIRNEKEFKADWETENVCDPDIEINKGIVTIEYNTGYADTYESRKFVYNPVDHPSHFQVPIR